VHAIQARKVKMYYAYLELKRAKESMCNELTLYTILLNQVDARVLWVCDRNLCRRSNL